MNVNARLDEQAYTVVAAAGLLLTSTLGDTTYVSMKNYARCRITISIADGTTVTGSTITLKQATAVAGTWGEGARLYPHARQYRLRHQSKTMTETAVTSNTFTTQTTNSKDSLYIIDVDASDLDVANGFDCSARGRHRACRNRLARRGRDL
jgi:hypothetical protein